MLWGVCVPAATDVCAAERKRTSCPLAATYISKEGIADVAESQCVRVYRASVCLSRTRATRHVCGWPLSESTRTEGIFVLCCCMYTTSVHWVLESPSRASYVLATKRTLLCQGYDSGGRTAKDMAGGSLMPSGVQPSHSAGIRLLRT